MPERKRRKRQRQPTYDVDQFAEDFDDLPDGAFFALAAEMDIEPEDFIPEKERAKKRKDR